MVETSRRREIEDAASSLFREHGYSGTSVRDIARALDIQGASLYAHVTSKQDVLWSIVERTATRFETAADAALAGADPWPVAGPGSRLAALVRAHVGVITDDVERASVFVSEWRSLAPDRRKDMGRRRDAYERRFRDQCLDAIARHTGRAPSHSKPPRFQAIFCIDEREESIRRHLEELAPDAEVTTEANPESVDAAYLEALVASGFNRLSLGMQSARPSVLAVLERRHTPGKVAEVMTAARAAGFGSINLDLIYGSPTETLDDWRASLSTALALTPEHVSAYSLIVEDGTRLARRIRRHELPAPDDDLF